QLLITKSECPSFVFFRAGTRTIHEPHETARTKLVPPLVFRGSFYLASRNHFKIGPHQKLALCPHLEFPVQNFITIPAKLNPELSGLIDRRPQLCGLCFMNDLRKLVRYFRPYRFSLCIAITCILGYVLFNLSIPLVVGRAIDTNWSDVTWTRLTIAALKVLGLSAVGGFLLFRQRI